MEADLISTLLARITGHFLNTHRWQRSLLTLSLLLFGGGAVGQATSFFGRVNEQTAATNAEPDTVKQPETTLRERISPWATGVGASIVGGFLIGFALRVFVRITIGLLALGATVMMCLSYFNIRNVDLTEAKDKYDTSIHWMQDQAYKLSKTVAHDHLPHTGAGALGAFAGFRRRRIIT